MYYTINKAQWAAVFIVALMAVPMVCVSGSEDTEADVVPSIVDASGNTLDDSYDFSRIITVGVGTLRWTSYFGYEDKVVCIDAGDANASSWNGKAYRSLFSFNQAELIKQMSGSTCHPSESDLKNYGMACHDHNAFSTSNLEDIQKWSEKPTVMIVSKSVYDGFTPEHIDGIKSIMKVVVIEEVDTFFDDSYTLSTGFQNNLSILAMVFGDTERANELSDSIYSVVKDIQNLVKGHSSKFSRAYVGGASQSGGKALTWSVGNYLPFNLTGVTNGYTGSTSSVATDGGSEVMSSASPTVMFIDLSTVKNITATGSVSVLTYANYNHTPIYTLLPYFWFGYNFDNALADAYVLCYACYDGILSAEECQDKIEKVYEAFYPNMTDGKKALDGFYSYYSANGSKLTLDYQAYNYDGSGFVKIDRPSGDVKNASNSGTDMTFVYVAIAALVVLALGAYILMKRR